MARWTLPIFIQFYSNYRQTPQMTSITYQVVCCWLILVTFTRVSLGHSLIERLFLYWPSSKYVMKLVIKKRVWSWCSGVWLPRTRGVWKEKLFRLVSAPLYHVSLDLTICRFNFIHHLLAQLQFLYHATFISWARTI